LAPLALAAVLLRSPALTAGDVAWGAAAGIVGGVGIGLLYHGLGTGTMSIVAPISSVCATALPVLAGIAFGERPSGQALTGIVLAIASIVLISQAHAPGAATVPVRHSVLTGVGSGVCVAAFLILMSRAHTGGLWPLFVSRTVATAELALLAVATRGALLPPRPLWTIATWCGIFDTGGTVLYILAVHRGSLGIVATLISLYPASTLLLARTILGERLRQRQMAGLAAAAAAVVLITAGAT
jgi:drug/metabolite transporter (DMT)-like permease